MENGGIFEQIKDLFTIQRDERIDSLARLALMRSYWLTFFLMSLAAAYYFIRFGGRPIAWITSIYLLLNLFILWWFYSRLPQTEEHDEYAVYVQRRPYLYLYAILLAFPTTATIFFSVSTSTISDDFVDDFLLWSAVVSVSILTVIGIQMWRGVLSRRKNLLVLLVAAISGAAGGYLGMTFGPGIIIALIYCALFIALAWVCYRWYKKRHW